MNWPDRGGRVITGNSRSLTISFCHQISHRNSLFTVEVWQKLQSLSMQGWYGLNGKWEVKDSYITCSPVHKHKQVVEREHAKQTWALSHAKNNKSTVQQTVMDWFLCFGLETAARFFENARVEDKILNFSSLLLIIPAYGCDLMFCVLGTFCRISWAEHVFQAADEAWKWQRYRGHTLRAVLEIIVIKWI